MLKLYYLVLNMWEEQREKPMYIMNIASCGSTELLPDVSTDQNINNFYHSNNGKYIKDET